jgi:poly-gamma-glutamate synthesis protein (capsule biosynthesis protein)
MTKKIILSLLLFLLFWQISVFFKEKEILSPSILSPDITPIATPTVIPTSIPLANVSFSLLGDIGLGRYITSTSRSKNNFNWPFQEVSSFLQSYDFNLANLESPVIADCPEGKTGTFTFCGDDKFMPFLKENKFIFNLNNNHILNYGQNGLQQTKNYLSEYQIPHFFDNFLYKEINGIKFGFLGFDFITYPQTDTNLVLEKIKNYNSQVDWLIISIHWGNEYLPSPEKWRLDLAHQMIDAGADIIHGHHPHVLQSIEYYKGKPIYYSLGNFVFDQNWSKKTSIGEIVVVTLNKKEIIKEFRHPYTIKFNSQPQLD